jgi:type IV secretion system protein TrbE
MHGRDGFAAAWLRERGLDWAADLIPDLVLSPSFPEPVFQTEEEPRS